MSQQLSVRSLRYAIHLRETLILSVPVLPYDFQNHTGADEAAKYDVTFAINRATGALTLLP